MMPKSDYHAQIALGIASIVRRERAQACMSLERVARDAGVTRGTVKHIEGGSGVPRMVTLFDVLWALDCSQAVWVEIAELDALLRAAARSAVA